VVSRVLFCSDNWHGLCNIHALLLARWSTCGIRCTFRWLSWRWVVVDVVRLWFIILSSHMLCYQLLFICRHSQFTPFLVYRVPVGLWKSWKFLISFSRTLKSLKMVQVFQNSSKFICGIFESPYRSSLWTRLVYTIRCSHDLIAMHCLVVTQFKCVVDLAEKSPTWLIFCFGGEGRVGRALYSVTLQVCKISEIITWKNTGMKVLEKSLNFSNLWNPED